MKKVSLRSVIDEELVRSLLYRCFDHSIEYSAIGNHHLKRHLVFKVTHLNKDYVVKFYFVNDRWNREIGTIKMLQSASKLIPELVEYGKIDIDDEKSSCVEYLIYKWKPGVLMKDIEDTISLARLNDIYFEFGVELGYIHNFSAYQMCGTLNEEGRFRMQFDTNQEYLQYELERIFRNLDKFEHTNQSLVDESKKAVLEEIWNLKDSVSVICHNDFGPRNILLNGESGDFNIIGLIDFEQGSISDGNREVIVLYQRILFENSLEFANQFLRGYQTQRSVDFSKERLYMLFMGLSICGWAMKADMDYYLYGMKILEKYC